MITAEKLLKFAPNIKDVAAHAAALEAARKESTVDNVRRLCAFLGQISVETGGFTLMEENLNYRNPERLDAVYSKVKGVEDAKALIAKGPQAIANRVYGAPNDLGNGDEASGDGLIGSLLAALARLLIGRHRHGVDVAAAAGQRGFSPRRMQEGQKR